MRLCDRRVRGGVKGNQKDIVCTADRHASGRRSITYGTMIVSIENDAISHFNRTACSILVSLSIKISPHIYIHQTNLKLNVYQCEREEKKIVMSLT